MILKEGIWNKSWHSKKHYEITSCAECNQEFWTRKRAKNQKGRKMAGRFCSRSCASKYHARVNPMEHIGKTGNENANWKGGVSKINIRYTNRFRAKFPEKAKAHQTVSRAIQSGRLKRQPCEKCSSTKDIHGHHHDYSKPLEVEWLCRKCHTEVHREIAKAS